MLCGPSRRGQPSRRHSSRDDRQGRHRMHRRRAADRRGGARGSLSHALRSAARTARRRWNWPFWSPRNSRRPERDEIADIARRREPAASVGLEVHRRAVHAVALPGRTRARHRTRAPRCPPHRLQCTSVRVMKKLRSSVVPTAPSSGGRSSASRCRFRTWCPDANSSWPQPAQMNLPCRFSGFSGLVPARSVPCLRSTWYCAGDSFARHSSSVCVTGNVSVSAACDEPNSLHRPASSGS